MNEDNKEPAFVDSFLNTIMHHFSLCFTLIHSMLSVKQAKKLTDCDIQKTHQRTVKVNFIPGYPKTVYHCQTGLNLKEARSCSLGWTKLTLTTSKVPLEIKAETPNGMKALLVSLRQGFGTRSYFRHRPATLKGPELELLTAR